MGVLGEILTRATGFMDAYDYTLNPYSGCFFGCTYCYAAFFSRDAEKRANWGYWVGVKENAVALLEKRKPGALDGKLIYMSSVTDPYQPVERELGLTRRLLEVMADRLDKPKLVVQTRSPDVVRDCDLFRRIEENGGRVQVNMTATTDDEDIRRTFEPFLPVQSGASERHWRSSVGRYRFLHHHDTSCCWSVAHLTLQTASVTRESRSSLPNHSTSSAASFLAGTREGAFNLMAEKLGCDRESFRSKYLDHYKNVFAVLKDRLPELGEGKDGFKASF